MRYDAIITSTQPHNPKYKVLTNANNIFFRIRTERRETRKKSFVCARPIQRKYAQDRQVHHHRSRVYA